MLERFEVKDITYQSKRFQNDTAGKTANKDLGLKGSKALDDLAKDVTGVLTLEGLIKLYGSREEAVFQVTASFLKELLGVRREALRVVAEKKKEGVSINVSENI